MPAVDTTNSVLVMRNDIKHGKELFSVARAGAGRRLGRDRGPVRGREADYRQGGAASVASAF